MNRKNLKILLIEDNPGDAGLIRAMLAESPIMTCSLKWVETLSEGMRLIEEEETDLILLDLGLPDSLGLDTLRRLYAGTRHKPAVVVMSGMGDEDIGVAAVQEGAQDYLVKGQVDGCLLIRSIRHAIERNEAEKALQHAHDELENQVRLRTEKLSQTIVALERENMERQRAEYEREKLQMQLMQVQKMESIGRLAGGIAHDFNNMLGVILGHAELAIKRSDQSQPMYIHLLEISKAAKRSANITRQLLAFARKQAVTPEILDLNKTLDGMLMMLRRLIGENIELVWTPGKNLEQIKIDPSQLDQILVNLCINARDAIETTGKIIIETGADTFDKTLCSSNAQFMPGDFVHLSVSDTGCGIAKENLPLLFEPFFSTKDVGKGTGLGLATIYGIVKQNNGFIDVHSEPGRGSQFTIYLPIHHGIDDRYSQDGDQAEAVSCGKNTILLVEDEISLLKTTSTILKQHGYTVLSASTPGEALRLADSYCGRIDLLISDIVMPDMNGNQLVKKLSAIFPNLRSILTSGYTAEIIARQGIIEQGVLFLPKPYSIRDLAAKIEKTLSKEQEI